MQDEGLQNVRTVLGTDTDPKLPSKVDAILIVDVYGEIDDPVAVLRNAAKYMKPQGRIGIVDFNPGGGGPGPEPDKRVDAQTAINDAARAGLQLRSREAVPPFQFMLVFSPAPSSTEPAPNPRRRTPGAQRSAPGVQRPRK